MTTTTITDRQDDNKHNLDRQDKSDNMMKDIDELALRAVAAFLRNAMIQTGTTTTSLVSERTEDSLAPNEETRPQLTMQYCAPANNESCNRSFQSRTTTTTEAQQPLSPQPLWSVHDMSDTESSSAAATSNVGGASSPTTSLGESDAAVIAGAHGVAVWALAADVHSQVPYHLDYAELIRYESNVIVPPVLAGTLQCSPMNVPGSGEATTTKNQEKAFTDFSTTTTTTTTMVGGDFCIYVGSNALEHYEKHGYKGAKKQLVHNNNDDKNWISIPYRYNRMICASGHLPHASSQIESITTSSSSSSSTQIKRVIVGFNVFLHDVGPTVQQAPEHSDAFRQRVAQQRRQRMQQEQQQEAAAATTDAVKKQKSSFTLADIQQNPNLSRLLIQAKRNKRKQEFLQAQEALDRDIVQILLSQSKESDGMTVQNLIDRLLQCANDNNYMGRENSRQFVWSANDLHSHIHHRCLQGNFLKCCLAQEDIGEEKQSDLPSPAKKSIVRLDAWVSLCETKNHNIENK